MKIELTTKQEYEVKYLEAFCHVRFWEDAVVNGKRDEDGKLIPCRYADCWKPIINIETGQIINWNKGMEANIYYKVCDNGVYVLQDENKLEVTEIEGYVPSIMCPGGDGYGDYVIMDITEDGTIKNWKIDLSDFID